MSKSFNIEKLMEASGVKFGTSGARGLAIEMTDSVCYAYTTAFLQHLEETKQVNVGCKVAIAGDLRPSTPRICAAVAKAIGDKGYEAIYCGEVPSPAVALYGLIYEVPSVMVTGSHIPDDRNGIKYNTPFGEIMKTDEQGIRRQTVVLTDELCDMKGFFTNILPLPEVDDEAEELYIKRTTGFFGAEALAGLRIGVYEHSCVGRDVLKTIYSKLGAEVTGLGRSEKFIPVDTEAIRPEDCALAAEWGATGKFDAILSADGDCDRPIIADENGKWLRGDVAGIICGRFLGADVVATPVSCNTAVELCGSFSSVVRTQIGSPYVIAGMKEATAKGAVMVVGYEANGGFLTNSPFVSGDKVLSALPTRDAVILHLALLVESKKRGCTISELAGDLPERYTISNRLKEFSSEKSQEKLASFKSGDFSADCLKVEGQFGILCGKVQGIDQTDGLRITFENSEIVHLRPSGNAPELRCYNEAATESRAQELNDKCIALMEYWR